MLRKINKVRFTYSTWPEHWNERAERDQYSGKEKIQASGKEYFYIGKEYFLDGLAKSFDSTVYVSS